MLLRLLAELLLTAGTLLLLLVVYQLWYTNVLAGRSAHQATNALEQEWKRPADPSRPSGTPAGKPDAFTPGQGFAIMHIPTLGVKAPVAEGTGKKNVLDRGMIGHYDGADGGPSSAMPWDAEGNFAVAAHRNSHGEPFRHINRLRQGDLVVVETAHTYYTYEVTGSLPYTTPANSGVVAPVPKDSGFEEPGRYITLTTCTPEFSSSHRLIVWGQLLSEHARSLGLPPALVSAR
ncbi:class E sortase [Streptomyces vinaceus]|uniref:class E sortase n=1 Tax=Streptomyces vinaceus TaxID=1960 RepID=UPI0037F25B6D